MNQEIINPVFVSTLQSSTGIVVYFIEKSIVEGVVEEFDLNDTQEEWVDERVSFHRSLHLRSVVIGEMVAVMEEGHKNYQDKITAEELDFVTNQSRAVLETIWTLVLVKVGKLVGQLDEKQWEYHLKKQERDKEEAKKEKEESDEEDEGPRTIKDIYKKYEEMYGSLDDDQKEDCRFI